METRRSITRVSLKRQDDVLEHVESLDNEPIIISNITELFPELVYFMENFSTMEALKKAAQSDDSMVGVVTSGSVSAMTLREALEVIGSSGGYINGWEYAASGKFCIGGLDEVIGRVSLIPKKFGTSGRILDSVMKWIFISDNTGESGSDWHVDPIGSVAFMLMINGRKKWFVGDSWEDILTPGELLLLPPGTIHKIENIGNELNVAVSHNWVTEGTVSESLMWSDVENGILDVHYSLSPETTVLSVIENLNDTGRIDNIQMGLLMILLQMSPDEVVSLVPEYLISYLRSFQASLSQDQGHKQ